MTQFDPDDPSGADRLTFAAANLSVYLRHPRLALTSILRTRRLVDFARPSTYGELIQWRKVFDRNPAFATYVDKLAAKHWARSICPDLLTAEVLWEGNDPDSLPEAMMSSGHVIKANNGCAQNHFPGRDTWPHRVFLRRARRWLGRRWARLGEWAYAQVTPRLYVERLIGEGRPLLDLTFRCFDGKVPLAFIATRWKTVEARAAYLDHTGRPLPASVDDAAPLPHGFIVPATAFACARRHAEQLSRGLDHMRVDFLIDGDDVYFGEVTLYSASGYGDEDRLGLGDELADHWFAAMDRSGFLTREHPWPLSLYQAAFRRYAAAHRSLSDPATVPGRASPAR